MSFILDALKKSEGQRQRQSGPALFEVKVAPPRTRIPVWAAGVAVLLLVNLGVVGWMALRPSPPTAGVPAGVQPELTAAAPAASPAGALPGAANEPASAPPARSERLLPDGPARTAEREPPSAAFDQDFEPDLIGDEDDALPVDDDVPAAMLDEPAIARAGAGRVTRGTDLGIPTYEQLLARASPAMPDLRLDLHVFATNPSGRFVFLNNTRLGEGDALPNGARVESIVPDGAVLTVGGTRFLMQRQ